MPLIVRYPGPEAPAGRRSDPIQLVDVPALVLEVLGLPAPGSMQGDRSHPVVAELDPLEVFNPTGRWRALIDWPYKYVWNSQGQGGLYDIDQDPLEQRDLGGRVPSACAGSSSPSWRRSPLRGRPAASASSTRSFSRGLRDLGYLGGQE